ncbi:hypothetical protein RZS08_30405, partial [Arthrospira platensis SPKY1]|nr:hypothetical protein [Arthrospira platensis SPKY1]
MSIACASVRPIPHKAEAIVVGFDFQKYADEGFLISPYQPSNDYIGRGIVNIKISPHIQEIPKGMYDQYKDN